MITFGTEEDTNAISLNLINDSDHDVNVEIDANSSNTPLNISPQIEILDSPSTSDRTPVLPQCISIASMESRIRNELINSI